MAALILIQEIHEDDVGLWFIVTVMDADGIVDMSQATVIKFRFQKPDGSLIVVDAKLLHDGTDGQVVYVTQPGDFDQPGTWKHQLYAEIGPDQKWSNIVKFKIYPNLPLQT
jgi:hypothetical protein